MHAIALDTPVPYSLTGLAEHYLNGDPRPFDSPDQEGPDELPPPELDDDEEHDGGNNTDGGGSARMVPVRVPETYALV